MADIAKATWTIKDAKGKVSQLSYHLDMEYFEALPPELISVTWFETLIAYINNITFALDAIIKGQIIDVSLALNPGRESLAFCKQAPLSDSDAEEKLTFTLQADDGTLSTSTIPTFIHEMFNGNSLPLNGFSEPEDPDLFAYIVWLVRADLPDDWSGAGEICNNRGVRIQGTNHVKNYRKIFSRSKRKR